MKKIFLFLITSLLLAGCVSDGKFKKSASNRWIDRKGFHGSKRRPLYNNKYIDRAKHNVAQGDFDEEYDDEEEYVENLPPVLKNRYIYEDMIEQDLRAEKAQRAKKRSRYIRRLKEARRNHPDLGRSRDRIRSRASDDSDNSELRQELREIKTLLDAARKDLVKYKCPIEEEDQKPPALKHEVKPKKVSVSDPDEEESQPLVNAKPPALKEEMDQTESIQIKKPSPPLEQYLQESDDNSEGQKPLKTEPAGGGDDSDTTPDSTTQ